MVEQEIRKQGGWTIMKRIGFWYLHGRITGSHNLL